MAASLLAGPLFYGRVGLVGFVCVKSMSGIAARMG